MEIEDILKYTLTLFQDIDKRLSELRNQQSIWDIKQDELLHYIENHNIDAVRACKIVKQLKYVRGERRKVKDEIDVVVSLKNTFIDKYKNLDCDYYTIDYAELEDGSWRIIEAGDGEVSGLAENQDYEQYYRALCQLVPSNKI